MKQLCITQILVGLFFFFSTLYASAENRQDGVERYNTTYYGSNAFFRLAGDDGIMTEADWINNRSAIETKYGADFRWDKAMAFDADGDGALSVAEARQYRDTEVTRLTSEWKKRGDRLTAEDKKWLKNHPAVAEKLAANSRYLEKHPKVAKAMYSDRKWLNSHPGVAEKMYGNRTWLNKHPEVANNLYENKKWLKNHPDVSQAAYKNKKLLNTHPQLSKDLKNHQTQLRKHPQKAKSGYKTAKGHPESSKKAYKAARKNNTNLVQVTGERKRAAKRKNKKQ